DEYRGEQTRAEAQAGEPARARSPHAREERGPQRRRLLYADRAYEEHRIEVHVRIEKGHGERLQQDRARGPRAARRGRRQGLPRAGAPARAEPVPAEEAGAGDRQPLERERVATERRGETVHPD